MKKGSEPTLADRVYRATYDLPPKRGPAAWWTERNKVRQFLFDARRFVLDDAMSSFLSDLSTAAFMQRTTKIVHRVNPKTGNSTNTLLQMRGAAAHKLIEQLRIGSRLPHKATWVEYNAKKWFVRDNELMGYHATEADIEHMTEGWLLRRHSLWHAASLFTNHGDNEILLFPWTYVWQVDDSLFPVGSGAWSTTAFCTGIDGYDNKRILAYPSEWCPKIHHEEDGMLDALAGQTGVMRRIFAFLATVNDIPVLTREVRASKGFIGRGGYHRFLDHQTIRLVVPIKKDLRRLARHVVAAARRRLHMVRGHWRKDWRHPPNPLCEHEWMDDGACKHCKGHRLWIAEHERGDASLGVMMTDYSVEHAT